MRPKILAGVEMGGTKCVCILGTGPSDIRGQEIIPTGEPEATLGAISEVLDCWNSKFGEIAALGVASFGPLDLRRSSSTYGRIGVTAKERWIDIDLAAHFRKRFSGPVEFSTDVIGAALAEGRWGKAQGLTDFAYVTIGTGVGVGLIAAGKPILGCHHPELGHMRIVRLPGDLWPGSCRFHGDCVEGLVSGPAIQARVGYSAADLSADSPIWESIAYVLGQLAQTLLLAAAPQRILIGGGVVNTRPHLFPRIRHYLATSLNGYLDIEEVTCGLDDFLGPPGLGASAGPLGALALAADTLSG